jgi:TatD DNase family protein
MLVDTHAHIHFEDYRPEIEDVLTRAAAADVGKVITVGCDDTDSASAVAVARAFDNVWATVGLHPHEADRGYEALDEIARLSELEKVVGIGEYGLDFNRAGYDQDAQERAMRFQLELAMEHDLASVFHVRDAFKDFFRILDEYDVRNNEQFRGVVHCFTAGVAEMDAAVERGLYVAMNGIMTFTKDPGQLEAARNLPLENLLLETDSPYLTPTPKRGQRNEPANTAITAKFLADLRGEAFEDLAAATTNNAERLFGIR